VPGGDAGPTDLGLGAGDGAPPADAALPPADAALPPADAALLLDGSVGLDASPLDAASPPDSGLPPACHSNTDCNAQHTCIDLAALGTSCATATCACYRNCDPFTANSGCPSGQGCFWWDYQDTLAALSHGVCAPDTGGGHLGEACTATFDASGNETSNSCDFAEGFLCESIEGMGSGRCARLCAVAGDTLCPSLGPYTCNPDLNGLTHAGSCKTVSQATDVGGSCSQGSDCASGICSSALGYTCTATCGALADCPSGSGCAGEPPGSATGICHTFCSADTDCEAGTLCQDFGLPPTSLMLCGPPCPPIDVYPCAPGRACDSSGHCG
jgi:hypothetical protein